VSKQKNLLYGLGLALATLVFFAFVGWPAVARWPGLNRDITRAQEELARLKAQADERGRRVEEYKDLAKLFRKRPGVTSAAQEMPRVLSRLQGVSGLAELELTAVQPMAIEESGEGWARLPVQLIARGGAESLTRMLLELRNMTPLTDVQRLQIRADPKDPKQWTVQMLIVSYVLLDVPAGESDSDRERKQPTRRTPPTRRQPTRRTP